MATSDDLIKEIPAGVFISHITEEKPVALVLQKHLRALFGATFPVFVSTDATSIGGGKKWFEYIINSLRSPSTRVVLSLVSQESRRRDWINFEAGFGDGAGRLLIPVAIRGFQLSQLSFPLSGYQGRSIDNISALVSDIGSMVGLTPGSIDLAGYLEEIREAEASVNYKSLRLEPHWDGSAIVFQLTNVGNVDLELLMIETYTPRVLVAPNFVPGYDQVDSAVVSRDGRDYQWYAVYSSRGAYRNIKPILRPVITRSMGVVPLANWFRIALRTGLGAAEQQQSILYQVHALGYASTLEVMRISDIPSG